MHLNCTEQILKFKKMCMHNILKGIIMFPHFSLYQQSNHKHHKQNDLKAMKGSSLNNTNFIWISVI